MTIKLLASTLALATICLPIGVLLAQTPNQGPAAQDATSGPNDAAQTAQGNNAASGNGASASGQLQEVVVTAERRSVSLQQTPIVISAISGTDSLQLHLNDLSSLQTAVPSFQVNNQGGLFYDVNIRGMGNTGSAQAVVNGVAIYRDGLLMAEPVQDSYPLFDIADTEILEGPQGTLVGAESVAGAIEINSADPNFNGLHGYILGSLATYSDTKFQGAVNLPVSDTFAVRFAFNSEEAGSFYEDIGGTSQGYFVNAAGQLQPMNDNVPGTSSSNVDPGHTDNREFRLKMLWQPTDKFQALGEVEYSAMISGGAAAEPTPFAYHTLFSGTSTSTGCSAVAAGTNFSGATGTQLVCPETGITSHSTYYYPGETPFVLDYLASNMEQNQYLMHYSLDLRYTLPGGTVLRSLSGFVDSSIPEIINPSYGPQNAGTEYHTLYADHYDSEEITLVSPTTGPLNWILGTYWDYISLNTDTNETIVKSPYLPDALPSDQEFEQSPTVNRMAAVFGNVNWQLTHTLQLQVGARENWDFDYVINTMPVAPTKGTTVAEPDGTGEYAINYNAADTEPVSYTVVSQQSSTEPPYHDAATTGKVDLNWTPIPGQNFYVFYARGYKPGGVNEGSTDHSTFVPENVNDYEAGWKGSVLDGHMLTQVGLYYDQYLNMQYQLYDTEADFDESTGNYIANLAPSTIYGLEASEQARFGGLGVNLGVGYVHSALGSVTALNSSGLPPGWGSPTQLPQCAAHGSYTTVQCFNYLPYEVNISGEPNPYAPTLTVNATVDYRIPVGAGTLDPRVTYTYTSHQYSSIFDDTYTLMTARQLWNASIDWLAGAWDVQLYGTNLTNEIYIIGAAAGGGDIFYGNPRQLGVQCTYKF